MATEHQSIIDPFVHEPKGITSATANQVYVANGSNSGVWTAPTLVTEMGQYNYDDNATAGSPIALTTPGTYYDLTNDGAGAATILTHKFSDIDNLWNTGTSRFDWSGLSVGDAVDLRIDILITTTNANTAVMCHLELATGSGSEIMIPLITATNFKSAGTYQQTRWQGIGMLSSLVQSNPARLRMTADTAGATVVVNGWYLRALRRVKAYGGV